MAPHRVTGGDPLEALENPAGILAGNGRPPCRRLNYVNVMSSDHYQASLVMAVQICHQSDWPTQSVYICENVLSGTNVVFLISRIEVQVNQSEHQNILQACDLGARVKRACHTIVIDVLGSRTNLRTQIFVFNVQTNLRIAFFRIRKSLYSQIFAYAFFVFRMRNIKIRRYAYAEMRYENWSGHGCSAYQKYALFAHSWRVFGPASMNKSWA